MIEILDTEAALHALQPEWDALWRATQAATPFQSPAWLLPWWQAFGTGMPRVGTLRRGGELVGVLPLYVLDEPGIRKLLPIGAGTTDYLDGLGEAAPLLSPVLERARVERVDRCDLLELPPHSTLIGAAVPPGWRAHWGEGSPCPVLCLPVIPGPIRRKLRMNRNRAERGGGTVLQTADAATVQPMLDTLIRLHQARWTAQGEAGVLAAAAVLALHRAAAPRLLAAGVLRLQMLHYAGAPAAAILALLAPGRILFYLSGFDETHAQISPGTLLLGAMLEQAIAEGRQEAHFLRGRERYKYAWGATDRGNRHGAIVPE